MENRETTQPDPTPPMTGGSRARLGIGFLIFVSGVGVALFESVLLVKGSDVGFGAISSIILSLALVVGGGAMMRRHKGALSRVEDTERNDEPEQERPSGGLVNVRAVITGLFFDWGGTSLYSLVLSFLAPVVLVLNGVDPQETVTAFEQIYGDPLFIGVVFLPIGFVFTVLGGYVAAWISRSTNLINAALVGSTGIVLSLFFASDNPLWLNYAGIIGAVPAAMIGGYLYVRAWRFA